MNLSPQQLHYFKRELVSVSLSKELEEFKQAPLAHLIQEDSPFPFLHFFFVRLVSPFPLLKKTDNSFWTQVETFWKAYQALTKDNYSPHQQNAPLLAYKLNHLLVIFLTNMIKTTQGEEESIDIRQDLLDDLDLAELESEENYMAWIGIEAPEIKLIGVRKRSHDEFLIKVDEVVVARRYGQFRQLQKDLLLLDQDVPELPNKARDPSYGSTKDCLYREKDRISLRLFLHQIANSELAQTKVFERFLTEDPIVLTMEEEVEIEERESMDRKRAQEEKKFRLQVDKKMVELDGLLSMMKTKVMQPKGLLEVFDVIKHTKDIGQLPDELKKAIEWGRINFAFVLHTQFVTSDKSVENVANLKRTHALMPYRAIAQILKLSNPLSMIKGILDLFLAQPFGQKSLFQRLVLANMNDDIKEMQHDIQALETKINDPILCLKLANAVKTKKTQETICIQDPILETLDVLKIPQIEPLLTPDQILKVAFANQPHQNEARELVQDLYELWMLYAKRHEHDILTQLIFQGETSDLIRHLFAVFYEPMAEVYKAANIGDSVLQVSAFMDDLIGLLDHLDIQDVTHSSELFIDLVSRHQDSFYAFVHNVHAKDQTKLFDALLAYVDSVFSLFRQGLPKKVDLDSCVKQALKPDEYAALEQEVDLVCEYHKQRKSNDLDKRRKEFSGILSDFEDMEPIKIPLTWIPRVSPFFVQQLI